MIGLRYAWSGEPLAPPLAHRFTSALGVGRDERFSCRTLEGALLAGRTAGRRGAGNPLLAQLPNGDAVLFHGHIDNRAELRRGLSAVTQSIEGDTQLYAACYAKFGASCDLKVIGQYAVIIWSPRAKQVRLARSPIQAPALHYWLDAHRLIVANVSQAIFATGEVDREIDEQKIADTLFLNYAEEERGWFKGVQRLPIGSTCIITQHGQITTRYYDLSGLPRVRLSRDSDYVEAADELFTQATRAALSGFSRPAVSLSGGYDSQAVAAYAVKVLGPDRPLAALTAVPEPGWDGRVGSRRIGDEGAQAAMLARMYPSIDHELLDAAGLSFGHKIASLFLMMGAPPRNAMNFHWIHEIRRRARERGCDVILTGTLGNATFSFDGEGTLPALLRRGRWMALAREIRAKQHRQGGASLRDVIAEVAMPLLPEGIWNAVHCWRHGVAVDRLPEWCGLNPDWARRMRVQERARHYESDPNFRYMPSTLAARCARLSGSEESGDLQQALESIGGVPRRDPTSYRPLFEFCFGLPDEQYLHNGESRRLARRLLTGKIPDPVLNEARRGLQSADWHLRLGRERMELRAEIDRLARDPAMDARFDLKRLRSALDAWPDKTPVGDWRATTTLWLALPRALATARFIQFVEGRNA
jgi:asparagine synthase (glutamine-hydrolysing)